MWILFAVLACDDTSVQVAPMMLQTVVWESEEVLNSLDPDLCTTQTDDLVVCSDDTYKVVENLTESMQIPSPNVKPNIQLLSSKTLDDVKALVLNGAHMGQYIRTVEDRQAWLQQSDWNQLYIPIPERTTKLGKMKVDVFVPTGSKVSICPFGTKIDFNRLTQALCVSLTREKRHIRITQINIRIPNPKSG